MGISLHSSVDSRHSIHSWSTLFLVRPWFKDLRLVKWNIYVTLDFSRFPSRNSSQSEKVTDYTMHIYDFLSLHVLGKHDVCCPNSSDLATTMTYGYSSIVSCWCIFLCVADVGSKRESGTILYSKRWEKTWKRCLVYINPYATSVL